MREFKFSSWDNYIVRTTPSGRKSGTYLGYMTGLFLTNKKIKRIKIYQENEIKGVKDIVKLSRNEFRSYNLEDNLRSFTLCHEGLIKALGKKWDKSILYVKLLKK